jgi:hypothetical protein
MFKKRPEEGLPEIYKNRDKNADATVMRKKRDSHYSFRAFEEIKLKQSEKIVKLTVNSFCNDFEVK